MKQQLANINDWLLDYIGQEMTPELRQEISNRLLKQKQEYVGFITFFQEVSLVWVNDKNGKIKAIGGTVPNDLISNQFGEFLRVLFNSVSNAIRSVTLTDKDSVAKTFRVTGQGQSFEHFWNNSNFTSAVSFMGGSIKVGSSGTTPTRADLDVNGQFPDAPENIEKSTSSLSVWNSGLGQITNGVSIGATGGSGNVAETVLFMEMDDFTSNNVSEEINFAHDLISPVVPFGFGTMINVAYTIQL